jgi:flagellin
MALTVLNNISSLTAENALSNTQANLQKTLTQLSTGLKINSGSDDAAGLSIASGLNANIAALTQSQQNASNGIGLLQTADGALSQVTTLLNRAVTLATEASTTGITTSQATALDTEFQSIKSEINQIGQATNFNGSNVFSTNAPVAFTSTQQSLATNTNLTSGSVTTIHDSSTGGTLVFTGQATGGTGTGTGGLSDVADLQGAINNAVAAGTLSAGTTATLDASTGQLDIATTTKGASLSVTTNDAVLGQMNAAVADSNSTNVVSTSTAITSGKTVTIADAGTSKTFTYTAGASDTVATLQAAISAAVSNGTLSAGTQSTINSSGKLQIWNANGVGETVGGTASSVLGAQVAGFTNSTGGTSTVYLGDGTTTGVANTEISTTINSLSASALNLGSDSLTSSASAITALSDITAAINTVSAQRGTIGASVNRLTAASSNMANQVTNLQSAANSIQDADVGKTVANMTQYNVLQSTGMAALQQSNQAQQAVLKLVQ